MSGGSATETDEPWRALLRRFWARHIAQRTGTIAGQAAENWGAESTLLRGLGLGLRETLSFVLDRGPTFDEFELWILEINGGTLPGERLERLNAALSGEQRSTDPHGNAILSSEDLTIFRRKRLRGCP